MGAGHNHADQGHGSVGHSHTDGANTRSLAIALSLTGSFLVAELVGAYWFNSLALLSDAAHMFTDAAALAIALVAVRIGQRSADAQRTYGYRRFEILAAAFNAVLLFVVAGYVLYEGISRFFDPQPVESIGMLAVASLGLVVNLIAMRVLAGGKETSLNMKGAYLEVWADMLGSLGVIGAAIAIWLTGKTWIDPIVAIAIGLWVLPRTWTLLRDTTHILLQGVPRGMDLDAIRAAIGAVPGVAGVHDLHVWSIAGDDASLTAHIAIASGHDQTAVRTAVAELLEAQFKIHHSTLQTETEPCGDEEALHA
ncbi:cation transporter [Pseudonocardia sp. TMWB2A]|uniref:cation diffusion facilitator family transporter n=1 Tax=Pseudonocardia sp. TMWB2A TaxID=687430 RepID=UPI00307F931D